jgi:hypothetical protein
VKVFTVHAEPPPSGPPALEGWPEPKARPPVLLREGFSLAAFLFGAFWFAWHRLWWWAAGLLALTLAAGLLLPDPFAGPVLLAIAVVAGMEGRDVLRDRLAARGLPMQGVVAAPDLDTAWARLVRERPELVRAVP